MFIMFMFHFFRQTQSINKAMIKRKEYKKLNSVFCDDRIEGWRLFKRMFRKKNTTKLSAEDVKTKFKKHFSERLTQPSPETQMHQEKVENFLKNHKPEKQPKSYLNDYQLSGILKKLKNGKRPGFSGVTYEMFKYMYGHNWCY